ncbi:MAG: ATP-dependent RNA helicase [Treponema sp.]|nr:ATP-dependent RNA helicase [Treponema sp.]
MHYLDLPVYRHKELILRALEDYQAIVVESPTGSGKTTQLPVILHEAGYSKGGMIGVTQPRRIAALSVSEFIARQMGEPMPGLVGYKMRFEDRTLPATKIKIMTDGILLQEMKLDPWLSKYDCLLVDEAHERSLNIDFILGLLKRVLEQRREFKLIISSATINALVFSEYLGQCPVVKIDAETYPVSLIYDPPVLGASASSLAVSDAMIAKIGAITGRLVQEEEGGDILVFLPGEKMIKDCMAALAQGPQRDKLSLVPLYGRLGKEEQERVFLPPPEGKTKVVIATNIAETSVTIDGISAVIDSGLSKLNHYNPKTFTSSLVESPISKASANQRRGRAGRTREGSCYRLYSRKDFQARPLFTTEEIFRTDLSEVVLRMADLGISSFEEFDFISSPGREGLVAAINTLKLLEALEEDHSLSSIGKLMTEFPLGPRHSRIIVEGILRYPQVLIETIIAAAFLSTQSPYILPPGEETDARRAHHRFRDEGGDFVSYLILYDAYNQSTSKDRFCEDNYLDPRAMAEIANVVVQLQEIVSSLKIPLQRGGSREDYLAAVARGLIQFVCVREGREMYRSLTAEKILIHPGSVMFRKNPEIIVAGEIIQTTRMYAMSVSPLPFSILSRISPALSRSLEDAHPGPKLQKPRDFTNRIKIGAEVFDIETIKGRKTVRLPWESLAPLRGTLKAEQRGLYKGLRGFISIENQYTLLGGEKLDLILSIFSSLGIEDYRSRKSQSNRLYRTPEDLDDLMKVLPDLVKAAPWKEGKKGSSRGKGKSKRGVLGFITLFSDGDGTYRITCSRGFHTSLHESLSSLESLIDELGDAPGGDKKRILNQCYRRLSDLVIPN